MVTSGKPGVTFMRSKEEDRKLRNLAQNKKRSENREEYNRSARESREKNKEKINESKRCPDRREKLNEGVKSWRKRNIEKYKKNLNEYRKENRIEVNARNLVYKHVKRGKMVKGKFCDTCKKEERLQAHHDDYGKPTEVRWLCNICHRHEHKKLLDVKP